MSSTLSSGDADRLRETLLLLLSPTAHADATAWRTAVCEKLLGWVGTDAVELTMTRTGDPPMVIAGRWGVDTVAEYMASWHNRQEVDAGMQQRRLNAWVRDDVVPRRDFRRTAYFKDFCAPQRILDSAGAKCQLPDGEQVILHLNSSKTGTFISGGRTATILQLLQPALAPAVQTLTALASARNAWALLDAASGAVGLFAMSGELLHATPRLAALLSDQRLAGRLRAEMRLLACEVARLVRQRSGAAALVPSRRIDVEDSRVLLSASVVDDPRLHPMPLCIITASRARPEESQPLTGRFGLTEREAQVALLLARGRRNDEIAAALGISEHTARRHTERVLAKLGVTSRAAVASALGVTG